MAVLTVGSLFSGIGAFDLGLERAGMRVLWQCERNAFRRQVLARHWPNVPQHADVRELRAGDVERVDVICGGFPCTGTSDAGGRAGLAHPSSGLWSEMLRLVRELGPRYVIVENSDRGWWQMGELGGMSDRNSQVLDSARPACLLSAAGGTRP